MLPRLIASNPLNLVGAFTRRQAAAARTATMRSKALALADAAGADPCKSGKTGRIIDSALKFARAILDKAISIR
jgi:hypothetical protein